MPAETKTKTAGTRNESERAPPAVPHSATIHKRSLTIAGHRTSISVEQAFWDAIRRIAVERRCSVAALVAEIDARRGGANLSSAIRLHVLTFFAGDGAQ